MVMDEPILSVDDLIFKDVWFRYGEEYVIKGMSFKIGEDEKVSIVGRSGVGKSTMVNLILGFLEPEKGEVLIGGIDVREIDKDFLRGKIGIIPQDVFIFSWSLRDNITLGKEVDEERLKRVIEYTGIDRIIENMPEGLDTELGERGARLSGGERQRIGIARVLLMEPEIVIFDEATSNLDSYSEEKIREFMEGWCKGRIIIVIAHRLSTIKRSERIIFIDNGKVEGEGRHKELMRNKRYKELFKGQLV
jgi:ABC-type multidrug transport system fused ATPase/permease subunit